MGVKVEFKSTNPHGFKKYLKSFEKSLKDKINVAGNLVQRSAKESILTGPKSGARRGRHTASAPGQPPASDTGFLANHIFVVQKKLEVDVESRANYSKFLEFGTAKMRARPFMFPALEKNRNKIRRMLKLVKGKV